MENKWKQDGRKKTGGGVGGGVLNRKRNRSGLRLRRTGTFLSSVALLFFMWLTVKLLSPCGMQSVLFIM